MAKFLGHALWREISESVAGRSKKIAIPYYSSDAIVQCGDGDVIIVDATDGCVSGGQTSAEVLFRAAERGAQVYCHRALHAKLVILAGCAFVSSANLSVTSTTLREAGVRITEPESLREIASYFDTLLAEAELLSSSEIQRLLDLPVLPKQDWSAAKPSLLRAFELNLPMLGDLTYGVSGGSSELQTSDVKTVASARHMRLPKGWTWFESSNRPGVVTRLKTCCTGRPLVNFLVAFDEDALIKRFRRHAPDARPFLDAFRVENYVVSIFGAPWRATPVDLSEGGVELAARLTAGVRRANRALCERVSNEEGVIDLDDMLHLFRLGAG